MPLTILKVYSMGIMDFQSPSLNSKKNIKKLEITFIYIEFSKLLSLVLAILSPHLWSKKGYYRGLVYLVMRILVFASSILICIFYLINHLITLPTIFLNAIIAVIAFRNSGPSKSGFLILLLFVFVLALELRIW